MSTPDFLAAWTGLDAQQRKKRLQWFASRTYEVQRDIVHRQIELANTARNARRWIRTHAEDCTLGCLIQAIDHFWRIDNSDRIRNATDQELEAKDFSDLRQIMARKDRKADKRGLLATHYKVIYKFREKRASWRVISEYLKKHVKLDVSHSYVQKVFLALAAERGEGDPFPSG